MNAVIGRLAAVVATAIVMFVLERLGLKVSEEDRAGIVNWLAQGMTALGTFGSLALYAAFHKFINGFIAPADAASGAQDAAPAPPRL
jgi:hypothetical protein